MPSWFGVVTLFPDMIAQGLSYGIPARAQADGLVTVACFNPRDFTEDVHRTVDDRPYGGGPGMVMKPEPLAAAIRAAIGKAPVKPTVVFMAPHGRVLTQKQLCTWAEAEQPTAMVIIAGRYEGIDERIIDLFVDECISVGDYVLSGGEIPALTLIDAVTRLLPGALGHQASALEDSFMNGQLDFPHYTRPATFEGKAVPAVLMSGHGANIAKWREEAARERTMAWRPDLLKNNGEESKGDE
ncbi:MAG: tRNA (guanosine(37)-N1)-methyltransferase TrmD [Legionellales bacterium]|nr:tRNA (guanosine(37)-N1)-methyltransferase TrmD [Legionellales bacterium]|tara:strand:+ start:65 stop:787 length:723 start_codon:yes stop_codon:yes gene_type:complete